MRIALYTCITGGYDAIHSPPVIDPRLDYYLFTDGPLPVHGPWRVRDTSSLGLSPKDQNRFVKMHPHKVLGEYDVSLYIDGSIRVVGDVHELILNSFGSLASVYMYEHPARRCVYREAEIVSSISHDWIWNIAKQMRRYRREGFPTDYGLFEANVIIRRHDDAMERLMTKWWDEYLRGVRRDQLSLTYCAWKESVEIRSLGLSDARFTNRYFSFREHPRKRSIPIALRKHINKAVGHVVGYERLFGLGR